MERFKYIPKEYLEERPKVFTEKSFSTVLSFAYRFDRLTVPISEEEIKAYERKYGSPLTKISPEEIAELQSISDLGVLVNEKVGQLIKKELGEILSPPLEAEELTNEKRRAIWGDKEKEALLKASVDKSWTDIDKENKDLMTTALGVSLVSERARLRAMSKILEVSPKNVLERFNMTEKQRDAINLFLEVIIGINTEYLRHHARLEKKEPYAQRPTDLLREHRFLAKGFQEVIEGINKIIAEEGQLFGSAERDQSLLEYLKDLQRIYMPFEEETVAPLKHSERQERLKKAQQSFLKLHTKFPDFPLVVFPSFSHYESDEVVAEKEDMRNEWQAFGYDPELRLYWQTREQLEKQQNYSEIKDKFIKEIEKDFSDFTETKDIKSKRIVLAEPIAATGINLREETMAQEEENLVLLVDTDPYQGQEEFQKFFESSLKDPEDVLLVRSEKFKDLLKKTTILHELGHGLFSESSPAAEALGEYDDMLAELKSELAMWSTTIRILEEEATVQFKEKAIRAIQLTMAREAMRYFREESQDSPYFLAGWKVLEILDEAGGLVEEEGKLKLVNEKLDQALALKFAEKFKEILQIYNSAFRGGKNIEIAQKQSQKIIEAKLPLKLEKLKI